MPSEKFYPQGSVEGVPSDHLDVAWNRDYEDVHLAMVIQGNGLVHASSIVLDRSGVNRMIRSLRKARDQVYGQDE